MNNSLPALQSEYAELKGQLDDPNVYGRKDYPRLAKRFAELEKIFALHDEIDRLNNAISANDQIIGDGGELAELADLVALFAAAAQRRSRPPEPARARPS